jgi:hypothetical protein
MRKLSMEKHERVELQHLIHADALEEWHLTEVSGSIHQVPPGPAVLIERRGGTFDAALPLLKEVSRGS